MFTPEQSFKKCILFQKVNLDFAPEVNEWIRRTPSTYTPSLPAADGADDDDADPIAHAHSPSPLSLAILSATDRTRSTVRVRTRDKREKSRPRRPSSEKSSVKIAKV